jgi:hypothetical protein
MPEALRKIGRTDNPATIAWCAERGHPFQTYNPWLDASVCRCGEAYMDGEYEATDATWRAMHETFHACEYSSGPCGCYARTAQASLDARARRA